MPFCGFLAVVFTLCLASSGVYRCFTHLVSTTSLSGFNNMPMDLNYVKDGSEQGVWACELCGHWSWEDSGRLLCFGNFHGWVSVTNGVGWGDWRLVYLSRFGP